MPDSSIAVRYDGPAISGGEMAVRDLAPSLLALGELVEHAHALAYPDGARPTLNVRAVDQGSFIVDLSLVETILEQARHLFTRENIDTAADIKAVLFESVGLFAVIKWARGRIVKRATDSEPGSVTLTVDDDRLTIPEIVYRLYIDVTIREDARAVVSPLETEGIESVTFTERNASGQHISFAKSEYDYFDIPEVEEIVLLDNTDERVLQIVSAVFRDGNKWRFTDGGGNTFYASIRDSEFLRNIELGEAFGKRDYLRVELRTVQSQTASGLKADYEVVQVLDHITAPRQTRLDFDTETKPVTVRFVQPTGFAHLGDGDIEAEQQRDDDRPGNEGGDDDDDGNAIGLK